MGNDLCSETKYESVSKTREESRNEGADGYTWHHTAEFYNGKCYMQCVLTSVHSAITHIGGVSIHPEDRGRY